MKPLKIIRKILKEYFLVLKYLKDNAYKQMQMVIKLELIIIFHIKHKFKVIIDSNEVFLIKFLFLTLFFSSLKTVSNSNYLFRL